MNGSNTYTLSVFDRFLNHGWRLPSLVHDHDISASDRDELVAQVASNDYFAMLATHLDQLSQNLAASQQSDYLTLEKLISDLLYLQQHYKIVKH